MHISSFASSFDRNEEIGAPCCDHIESEAREEMQTFNPETTVGKESTKRRIGKREKERERMCVYMCEWEKKEKEKDTFSMSESKVTIFLPTFRKKYVFIISFIFDYIPFVIEISAPSRESPLCRKPSISLFATSIYTANFLDIHRAPRCWHFFRSAARSTLIKESITLCVTFVKLAPMNH